METDLKCRSKPEVMELPPITLGDILKHPGDYLIAGIGVTILVSICVVESLVNCLDRSKKFNPRSR